MAQQQTNTKEYDETSFTASLISNEREKISHTEESIQRGWRNPFGPLLCRLGLILLVVAFTAWQYGTFTDGLPYAYHWGPVISAITSFVRRLRNVLGLLIFQMKIFGITFQQIAIHLQKSTFLSITVFFLIILYLGSVINYHQTI